jgi:hypothetical protein
MDGKKTWPRLTLVGLTLVSIIAAYDVSTLAHEWTHATVAWLLGHKDNPFNIHYGDWTLLNVNEAVDYQGLFAAGQGIAVAVIGISALITNTVLFLSSLHWLSKKPVQQRHCLYLLLYWFALLNISELYSYIPLRTFAATGDVRNFTRGLAISPWIVFVPGSLAIGWGIWYFLRKALPPAYEILALDSRFSRRVYLGTTLFILFIFFGLTPYHYGPHEANNIWILVSFAIGLGVFFVLNPGAAEAKGEGGKGGA